MGFSMKLDIFRRPILPESFVYYFTNKAQIGGRQAPLSTSMSVHYVEPFKNQLRIQSYRRTPYGALGNHWSSIGTTDEYPYSNASSSIYISTVGLPEPKGGETIGKDYFGTPVQKGDTVVFSLGCLTTFQPGAKRIVYKKPMIIAGMVCGSNEVRVTRCISLFKSIEFPPKEVRSYSSKASLRFFSWFRPSSCFVLKNHPNLLKQRMVML